MSDNFATKKSVWKETVENNNVLFILPGIIALLGFGMLFGWLLTFTPFPILTMNDVRTDFSDSIVLPYLFHLYKRLDIYTGCGGNWRITLYLRYLSTKKAGSNYEILQTAPNRRGNAYSNRKRIIF